KPHAVHLHRIFSRHIAQKILTYVSMPAILLCNLPTKSTAHLNDGRFLEMPFKYLSVCSVCSKMSLPFFSLLISNTAGDGSSLSKPVSEF
ncbi:MAG: hypothetical protein VZR27_08035, partial [Acutalibacteraceae bacterium]|nr:hypothetical protein [Acutalibacteraceae bacterium]